MFAMWAFADFAPFVEFVSVAFDGVVDVFDGWKLFKRLFDHAEVLGSAAAGGGGAHLGEQELGEIDVSGAVFDVDVFENAVGVSRWHAAVAVRLFVLGRTFE